MTSLDWALVVVINLGIVIYGVWVIKSKDESFDYFLAAKTLPWWAVGLSAFGTAVDTGDYVAVAGGAYRFGISQLAFWWLGLAVGWFVLSFFVLKAMYRTGMYTNAEWLEFRFGPITRVLAVFINIQSRTNVLGNIYFSMFLVLNIVAGVPRGWSWVVVVLVALTAIAYIVTGGLRSDVITDVMQAVPMVIGSFVLGGAVWWSVGGWSGLPRSSPPSTRSSPRSSCTSAGTRPAACRPPWSSSGW